jgi:YVTN family beta-propeller protein
MKAFKLLMILFILLMFAGCEEGGPVIDNTGLVYLKGNGVFVVNEGNYTGGNGSLSFYSTDSAKIYNDIFRKINERPLGDVPNSMTIYGDNAYIVVNNSGKIEVVRKNTIESTGTIINLISPRIIKVINSRKAYVSSLYSDSIAIIDPAVNSISGYINIRRSSEAIEISGNKAFIANWSGGKEIMVINTHTNKVSDSIMVAKEPESMVIDKDDKLWVLCTGGYQNKEFPELIRINTFTNAIEQRLIFEDKYAFPSNLQINGQKNMLVWLDNGVQKMDIYSLELPSSVFIPQKRSYFYKMGIDPVSGEIFVTDAIDYQQNGKVFRYSSGGTVIDSVIANIIPASFCFKQTIDE